MQLLQDMVSHVIVHSSFILDGHGVLTKLEHGLMITIV